MKFNFRGVFACAIYLLSSGCSKDADQQDAAQGQLNVGVSYSVDGSPLILDTLLYVDDVAGYAYKVHDVTYYLSDLRLIRTDSSELVIRNYQFVPGNATSGDQFTIGGIQRADYIGLAFNIGLTPALNHYGTLTDVPDNRSMQWPTQYGDGYYFFRFSGEYGDPLDTLRLPFEMAIGENANAVAYRFYTAIGIGTVPAVVRFDMNLNEWLKHPNDYDFNTYGPYSAGNPVAMGLLKVNGADALTLR